MKFRNTLILLGFVIVLFAFIYMFEIRNPKKDDGKSQNLGQKLMLARENINRIELSYSDANYEDIVCYMDSNGKWQKECYS